MNYFEKKQWIRLGICVVVLIAVSLFLTGIIGGKNLTYQLPENVEETTAVELPQGENVKTATAKGFASDVTVAVTMEGEKITALTVDDSGESYPVAREDSVEKVIAAIIEANGTDGVDVNTGATFTCTAIVNAVNEILAPDAGTVYEGEAQGLLSTVKAKVTVNEKEITGLEIDASGETDTLGGIAAEKLTAKILEAQTPNVDTVSGATVTSNAVIKAVTEALEKAGVDIAELDANRRDKGGEDKPREEKTIDTEIVIIGAGGAGMTAAIMTKQAGKDFVLLEKMSYAGGNTTKATGGMNAAETHYQKEQGIEDSVELFAADTIKGGHDLNDPELVGVMAKESAGAIDWLDSIGAELPKISFSGGASVNRIHAPADGSGVGEYLVEKFSAKLEELGVDIMYETKATELLTDADGKICGVKAEGADCDYIFNCKAVILATGGFGANEEMYTQYRPDLKGTVTTNAPGATGDGIVMAQALGADLVDIEQIQLHPTVEQSTSMLITESVRGDGAILVNQSGVRFTNELLTRDAVSAAELEQEGCYAYIIFDQNLRDHLKAVEKYVKTGITVQADTIEGLAEQLQIDPATLAKTLADWNEYVKNQNDPDFGRTTGMEADLTTPPYYAIKIAPGIHHTMGGVKIDTSAHVINTEGKAIPGLYAAGEVTGGVHGGNRLGGNAVADIVIFGRIAAETAIAELDGANVPETPQEPNADKNDNVKTVTKQGYDNGDVIVTVTVGDGNTVENLEIDSSSQTPGLGQKAMEEDFIKQFIGKTGPFAYGDGIDAITNATMTSNAVLDAINEALGTEATPDAEPEPTSEPETTETVTTETEPVETEQDAAKVSPSVIRQVMVTMGNNSENNIVIDYLEQDPYLVNIYEGFGFAKDYGSARGHTYTLEDVSKTQRPHPKANCITCKTDDFAKMVNTEGISVYSMPFDDVIGQMNNTISCYTCHGDGMGADGQVAVTHSYVNTALGDAAGDIPAAILACGQCHIEYYFTPSDSETMMPYHSKAEMLPEAILAYYDGMGFYDWEQPGTGTKMLKAQHPETETVLNSGHFAKTGMTCADCHMPVQTTEDGVDYKSHTFISPIQNETLLDTCAKCHGGAEAVISLVQNTQAKVTARETEVGNKLSALKDALTAAAAEGKLSDEELDALRKLHREAQWYFDFCYVENSEGAHNSKLSLSCLDTSESKIDEAMALMAPAE